MGFHIIVFVDQKEKHAIAAAFIKSQLPTLVDAVHGKDKQYLCANFPNARFFYVSDFLSSCTSEELAGVKPDFVVAFDVDLKLSPRDWVCIEQYLESILFPGIPKQSDIIEQGKSFLTFDTVAPLFVPPEIQEHSGEQSYELIVHPVVERDTVLIQVEKPFCDLPYTVVIHNFKEKGMLSFFTDLFISQTWGVSRKDIQFLYEVWKHWDMEKEHGPLNLEQRLHEATQRCFPKEGVVPEAEPIVYRRPIESVLKTLEAKEKGSSEESDDFWNTLRLRKRKQNDLLL